MTEILDFALVGTAPPTARTAWVPRHFQNAIDRHQSNLIARSAALKEAGITPVAAADYIDAAIASFQTRLGGRYFHAGGDEP